ncbi:MAG: indole-3-glycerol phosphate synthase TrpC [Lapillicoccus sp.]
MPDPAPAARSVLDDIVGGVRADLASRMAAISETELERRAADAPAALDAEAALRAAHGVAVIAEVKRASPSKGALAEIADPAALAAQHAAGGATAISVLTERRRFSGSLDDLAAVRSQVAIPVLRKDFLVTRYQVTEARAWGADMVLLIVASLGQRDLVALREHAESLGMTALVEVHDEDETRRAVDSGSTVVGVNARDLRTLEVDRSVFARVRSLIPNDVVTIAESGVRTVDDVREYAAAGAHGVLVGEALVVGGDPAGAVAAFASVGVRATPGLRSPRRTVRA